MSCLECKKCPVSTEPVYGHHLTWWHSVPENLRATCFSMSGVWHFRLVYMMIKLSYKCVAVCQKMFNNIFKFLSVHLAIFAQKNLLWLMFAVKFCENFKSWNDLVKLLLCAGKFNLVWVVGCWGLVEGRDGWWRFFTDLSVLILSNNYLFLFSDRGCTTKQGWQPRGNYLDSGINQADDVYMTLKLPVEGFGSPEGLKNPKRGQFGVVEFVFELICDGECTFKFKEVIHISQKSSWMSTYSSSPWISIFLKS